MSDQAAVGDGVWLRETAYALSLRRRPSIAARSVTLLALGEGLAVMGAGLVAKVAYLDLYAGFDQPLLPYLPPVLLLGLCCYLFLKHMELYEPVALMKPVVGYGKLVGGLSLSFLVLLGALYLFKSAGYFSRGWVLAWFILSVPSTVLVRWGMTKRVDRLAREGRFSQRVALFGVPSYVDGFAAQLESACAFAKVCGRYHVASKDDPAGLSNGGLAELQRALSLGLYDRVVVVMPPVDRAGIQAAIKGLGSFSTELLLCTDLEPGAVSVSGSWTVGSVRADVVNTVPLSERHGFVKQALDLVVAGLGLVLLAPFFLIVALAIKLDSPGPVFFRQRRYGQNKRIFRIFKFRTMHVTEDGAVVRQAERGDARVTRVGRLLRRTSIDEVPQLLNVLLGDMSIVGPRPHALAHDNDFEERLDTFERRRRVRPGLTGWAQVHGYRGETRSTDDVRRRLEHDLYYIENWSIWLDLEIILRTIAVVGRGAY